MAFWIFCLHFCAAWRSGRTMSIFYTVHCCAYSFDFLFVFLVTGTTEYWSFVHLKWRLYQVLHSKMRISLHWKKNAWQILAENVNLHKNVVTHRSPGSICYLGVFFKTLNNHLDEVLIIVITCTHQNLADDVGGCVMEHNLRIQGCTWEGYNNDNTLRGDTVYRYMRSAAYQCFFLVFPLCTVSLQESFAPWTASLDRNPSRSSERSGDAPSR